MPKWPKKKNLKEKIKLARKQKAFFRKWAKILLKVTEIISLEQDLFRLKLDEKELLEGALNKI